MIEFLARPQRLLGPLALGDVLIDHLRLSGAVPNDSLAEDPEMANFAGFPHNTYFIFGRARLAPPSLLLSDLPLGITLRRIALAQGCPSQLLKAVVTIDIQNRLVGIKGLALRGNDAHAQRGVIQGTTEVFLRLPQRLLGPLAPGDVADHGLEDPCAIQFHGSEQHIGGKDLARIGSPVHPLEVEAALFHRRGDASAGQRPGIRAAWLHRRRHISGVFRAELLPGGAAEHRQGSPVAVEKTVLIQQHDGIAGRFIERAELRLRSA